MSGKMAAMKAAAKASDSPKKLCEFTDEEIVGELDNRVEGLFNRDPNAPTPIRDAIAAFLSSETFMKFVSQLFAKFLA